MYSLRYENNTKADLNEIWHDKARQPVWLTTTAKQNGATNYYYITKIMCV